MYNKRKVQTIFNSVNFNILDVYKIFYYID